MHFSEGVSTVNLPELLVASSDLLWREALDLVTVGCVLTRVGCNPFPAVGYFKWFCVAHFPAFQFTLGTFGSMSNSPVSRIAFQRMSIDLLTSIKSLSRPSFT